MTEVWLHDVYTYHANNDFCRDWFPFMTDLGYDIIKLKGRQKVEGIDNIKAQCGQQLLKHPTRPRPSESAGLQEADAYWVRRGTDASISFPDCPKIQDLNKTYTAEEYASCG